MGFYEPGSRGRLATAGQPNNSWGVCRLIALVIADRRYDTDAGRGAMNPRGATPNIPPKINRCFKPALYRYRMAV